MSREKLYKTFFRSATNWEEFSSAEKVEDETDLTYSEARERCEAFNKNRTEAQERAGMKLEFTEQ